MVKLNNKKADFYIAGDFNINALKYDEMPNAKSFIDMMYANSAINLINKPTRFPRGAQSGSPSLLDHVYTNKQNTFKNIGLLINHISDHMPIVATVAIRPNKMNTNNLNPYIRDFKNFDIEKFNQSLCQVEDVETDDLDKSFEKLHTHFVKCVNNHIPLRKRTKKETKFALKP